MRNALIILLTLFVVGNVSGAEWYVTVTGTGDGTGAGVPAGTIQECYDNVAFATGDNINVAAGEYRQDFTFGSNVNFTVTGAGKGVTILSGGVILDGGSDWTQVGATDVWWYQESSTFYNSVWVNDITPYLFAGSYPPSAGASYTANDTLYIHMVGDGDPNDSTIEASTESYDNTGMILCTADLSDEVITFQDLTVSGVYGTAIWIRSTGTTDGTINFDIAIGNVVVNNANDGAIYLTTSTNTSSTHTFDFNGSWIYSMTNLWNQNGGFAITLAYDGTFLFDSCLITNMRGASGYGSDIFRIGGSSDIDKTFRMRKSLYYKNNHSEETHAGFGIYAENVHIDTCGFVFSKNGTDGTFALQDFLDTASFENNFFYACSAYSGGNSPISGCISSVHPTENNTPFYYINNNIVDYCAGGSTGNDDAAFMRIGHGTYCDAKELVMTNNIIKNCPDGEVIDLATDEQMTVTNSDNTYYNNAQPEFAWTDCSGTTPYGTDAGDYNSANDVVDPGTEPATTEADSLIVLLATISDNAFDSLMAAYQGYVNGDYAPSEETLIRGTTLRGVTIGSE